MKWPDRFNQGGSADFVSADRDRYLVGRTPAFSAGGRRGDDRGVDTCRLAGPQPVHVSASAIRSPSQGSTPHRPEFTDRDALEHGLRQIREEAYELFVPADVGPLQAAAQRLGT